MFPSLSSSQRDDDPTRRTVRRRRAHIPILERTVNGQPGLIAQQDGITVTVFAFEIADGQITHIWAIRNPGKLRPWTTG
jgi:RNA polymerase sigma-70 factor, ECF subfamily